jgi:hypothetical protein
MEVLLKLPLAMWPFALVVLLVHSALIETPAEPEG